MNTSNASNFETTLTPEEVATAPFIGGIATSEVVDTFSVPLDAFSNDLEAQVAAFAAELAGGELSAEDIEMMGDLDFHNEEQAELNQYNQLVTQDNDIAHNVVAGMEANDPTIAQRAALQAQVHAAQQALTLTMARPINMAERREKKKAAKDKEKKGSASEERRAA